MRDKRDECGCHRGCTVTAHECLKPCRWPDCLTDEESGQLAAEVLRELLTVDVMQPPGVVTLRSGDQSKSIFVGVTIRRRPPDVAS